ncbi:cytochrome c oxidase assembly protein [Arthrobacter agilis]|uniref:cytochrome c oxidase assembly protein n=1 Tax=Arthrobacter agilis TaxID=37921 RepID=UPI000B35BFD3|nr:cytochrome c oxidase assembly protein [Arthrobacter agilis]OUM45500.1 hypothetical protein B8W74_00620 [Arthrobacter agilis]PPB47715.1 cytochrome c oxidase assembly protein [Arthrobacter agilis]TPV26581.1 cytochrome c oxidase assembly protein [Arthrobacter agilis]VDR33504.1 Cytochrome c oxidase caa3 assembly factor (Caa3_CtaG) [Arthrobacter agilis]
MSLTARIPEAVPYALQHHPPGAAGPSPGTAGDVAAQIAVVLLWLAVAVAYLVAGRVAVLRGRTAWPVRRTVSWLGGAGFGLVVTTGPVATAAAASLTVHTAVHLVLGMLVPLLLVLGAPVTLFLRAVPARVGRGYSRAARARPLQALAHPLTGLLLTSVPLAVLYWDGTMLPLLHHPVLGPLIHVHFVAAGTLFAYAVVGRDPHPRRASPTLRGAAVVASIAVHGIVSKHLYSTAGVQAARADVEQAAQLMYYGGDALHVLLLVAFCAGIYRRTGRNPGIPTGRARLGGLPGRVV